MTCSHLFVWCIRCPASLLIEYPAQERLSILEHLSSETQPSSDLVATLCRACDRKRPGSSCSSLDIAVCRVKGMLIYKNACKISDRIVNVATAPNGSLLFVSMDKISRALKTAALYGLDPVLFNEEQLLGSGLLIPQVSSCFI